ncbi:hypothetical protein GCM10027426_02480 [Microbacterium lacusdiani]
MHPRVISRDGCDLATDDVTWAAGVQAGLSCGSGRCGDRDAVCARRVSESFVIGDERLQVVAQRER